MSVQQLSSSYINALKARNNGAQLDAFVKNGTIIEKDGKYYVAGKNIQMFSFDNAFEVDETTGKPKEFQFNVKGAVVERTTEQKEGQVVSETKETTFQFNQLTELMKLPEDKQEEFKAFLKSEGINIDDSGEIKTNNNKAIQDAVNKYVEQNKANFVKPGGEYIEFDEGSDPAGIAELEKPNGENAKPAITKQNDRYAVTNRNALNEALPTEDAPLTYEAADGRSASLTGSTVTTTERKRADLEVPADLKNNKDARKTLEAQARERYADFAADPNNRDAVDLYVAESRYEKQINKREQELLKMHDADGKKTTRNAADVVQLYLDKYANSEQARVVNSKVWELANTENEEDQQKLLEILKRDINAFGIDKESKFSDLSPVQKRNAALIAVSEANGTNPKDLLRLMAMQDVMGARTTEEIADDDKFFIKHQAEDYVKNRQANQEFPNANLNYDSIGKHGRKLVDKCSQLFGDEISASEFNAHKNDKANYYEANVVVDKEITQAEFQKGVERGDSNYIEVTVKNSETGKPEKKYYHRETETKHFKFNNKVWNTFMKVACDPTSANDEDIRLLSDHNMTLQEGRAGLEMRIPTNDGRMEEIRKIIGNSNDKTGNRELNRWRDLVEQTGLSVDSNPTAAKRLWHVVKNAGIGAGMGLLSGGISSLFGAVVAYAGQTAAQTVPYFGKTADRTISYSGVTEGGTMQHSFTVPGQDVNWSFTTEDQSYTKWVEHSVTVNGFEEIYEAPVTVEVKGQTYDGTVHIDPQTHTYTIEYPGGEYKGTITVEGQEYSGEVTAKEGEKYDGKTNNTKEQLRNATILGGIAGALRGLATKNKVDAKGRNTDDVYDFTYMKPDVKEEETQFTLQIPQYSTIEKRSGNKSTKLDTRKIVVGAGPHQYTALYQVDGQAVPDGPMKVALRKAMEAEWHKLGAASATARVPSEIPGIKTFPFTYNGKTYTATLRPDWKTCHIDADPTKPGGTFRINKGSNSRIAGTIRRG